MQSNREWQWVVDVQWYEVYVYYVLPANKIGTMVQNLGMVVHLNKNGIVMWICYWHWFGITAHWSCNECNGYQSKDPSKVHEFHEFYKMSKYDSKYLCFVHMRGGEGSIPIFYICKQYIYTNMQMIRQL